MAMVLHVPGLWNSGPEHWQSYWEKAYGHRRVLQADFDHPVREEWIETLERAVREAAAKSAEGPVVLAGHSLGCAAIAFWAQRFAPADAKRSGPHPVAGALLVAPSDSEAPGYPKEPVGFTPMPRGPLAFPSIVVASSDDPYVSLDRARTFAAAWGSRFVDAGPLGHINSDSRLERWPFGYALLRELVEAAVPAGR